MATSLPPRPIVIGWVGPLFWPYAYNDFVDYTFYPYAYDTFWPNAYDDVYEGMFGRYAYGTGSAYAAVGRVGSERGGARKAATADLCAGQTAGLTDWPIEQIAQAVEPNDAQRAALDEFKDAATKALDLLRASCPTELPSTPTGRLAAMHQRLDAMLAAVRMVRPAVETFYSAAQRRTEGALQRARSRQRSRIKPIPTRPHAGLRRTRLRGLRACRSSRLDGQCAPTRCSAPRSRSSRTPPSQAVELLKSDCPTYRALTPVVRLEAMEQRLDAMLAGGANRRAGAAEVLRLPGR